MKLGIAITAAAALAVGLGFHSTTALAGGECPQIGTLTNTNCNEVITFTADGGISTAIIDPTPYDGTNDTLVGIVNNTSSALMSIIISGTNLFGFEVDGLQTYGSGLGGSPDTTGYGGMTSSGENTSFSNYTSDTGTVVFGASGIAAGGTAYFSLEEAPSLSLTVNGIAQSAFEPGSLATFGIGAAGTFLAVRRRKAARGQLQEAVV